MRFWTRRLRTAFGVVALVSARDQRSGPRSVHWLAQIGVRVLKE